MKTLNSELKFTYNEMHKSWTYSWVLKNPQIWNTYSYKDTSKNSLVPLFSQCSPTSDVTIFLNFLTKDSSSTSQKHNCSTSILLCSPFYSAYGWIYASDWISIPFFLLLHNIPLYEYIAPRFVYLFPVGHLS